jgi:hypothetical protein
MKLLTTIVAVLISISAFSQDLIEYDNGTFTQNGEELSMEQVSDMTINYNVGKRRLAKAIKLRYAGRINTSKNLNRVKIVAGSHFIGIGFTIWWPWNPNDEYYYLYNEGDFDIIGIVSVATGTALILNGIYSLKPLEKADKYFSLVAQQLNEAIRVTNK